MGLRQLVVMCVYTYPYIILWLQCSKLESLDFTPDAMTGEQNRSRAETRATTYLE
jgi:hypothetical protein